MTRTPPVGSGIFAHENNQYGWIRLPDPPQENQKPEMKRSRLLETSIAFQVAPAGFACPIAQRNQWSNKKISLLEVSYI
jgi:hypothetical protein